MTIGLATTGLARSSAKLKIRPNLVCALRFEELNHVFSLAPLETCLYILIFINLAIIAMRLAKRNYFL